MIIIDIIIAIIIAGSFFYGYKKGLINTLTSIIGFFVAIVLAFAFSGTLANYIKTSTPFYNGIKTSIGDTLKELVTTQNNNTNAEEIKKGEEKNTKTNFMFIEDMKKELQGTAEEFKAQKIAEYTEKITGYIINTASFFIIYILVIIIVSILNLMLNGLFSLPILDSVNKFSGMFANGIISVLKVQIILAVLALLSGLAAIAPVINIINQTTLVKMLYQNNILLNVINMFIK
ncbi:MAG: CvpA family protein [Clostridia bacterium]